MMIPAFPSLPSATMLSPMQTMSKLSGLGDDSVPVDTGTMVGSPDVFTPEEINLLMGGEAGPNASGLTSNSPTLSSYQDASGNMIFPGQGMVTPSGVVSYFNAPANPSPTKVATPQGMTAAQQAALANTLISGGFTLAKEIAAQPGMSISPGGAISFQNKGFPVGTSASVTTPSASSMSMLAIAAAIGFGIFAFSRNR